jgi:hypothetical protein
MTEETLVGHPAERRSEVRENLEQSRKVELKLLSLPIYLFKVKDTSPNGLCFLVKEDSDILNHIQIGQILQLKDYSEDNDKAFELLMCEIKHITNPDNGPFQGHRLVGLLILDRQLQIGS